MRIMVVDDDAITRLVIGVTLRNLGHEVTAVSDGATAWEQLHHDYHPLLITDWQMPGMNGLELIRRVRDAELPGYVYCVLLTARDAQSDRISGLDSGADDYLVKPVHAEELRARLRIGERILGLEQRLRDTNENLRYAATHDQLTGLLNRAALLDHVQAEVARQDRHGTPLSMAIFDIDHFKRINDRFGHLAGDQALTHVSRLLSSSVRPYDWIGRWGGEEFMLLLPETTRQEALKVVLRACQQIAIAPLHGLSEDESWLTLSAGLACRDEENSADKLFSRADQALYDAKRAGRNKVAVFEADGSCSVHQLPGS